MSNMVYKYWCEPASVGDRHLLERQIRLGQVYKSELAKIENRAWVLERASPAPDQRVRIFEAKNLAKRNLRATFVDQGLHWGTYQHVEEAADQSARTTRLANDVSEWGNRGYGMCAVHLQPARSLRGVDDNWVQIGGIVRHGSEVDRSGRVRPARHTEVKIRVGSSGRDPIWAVVHALVHRPLPQGAKVAWVCIKRWRIAEKFRWELLVTVVDKAQPAVHRSADRVAGVDIGWRRLDDGRMRIATWWGTDGRSGELALGNDSTGLPVLERDDEADALQSTRKKNLQVVRQMLRAFRDAVHEPWFLAATSTLHVWEKRRHFLRLLSEWRQRRFGGDDACFAALVAWRKQDRHLYEWQQNTRQRRQSFVNDAIRQFAANLCREYGRIGIEAPLTASLVRRTHCQVCAGQPKRCHACAEREALRRLAATRVPHAAPARTRQEIEMLAKKYGAVAIRIDPAYTTMNCSACGHRRDADYVQIMITCSNCGITEDQDLTAAKNLAQLASAVVLDEAGRPLAPVKASSSVAKARSRGTRKRKIVTPFESAGVTK